MMKLVVMIISQLVVVKMCGQCVDSIMQDSYVKSVLVVFGMMGERLLLKFWVIQCVGCVSMKCGVGLCLWGEVEGGGGKGEEVWFMNGND